MAAAGSAARSIARSLNSRDSQTLTLPDRRVLGYGEFGDPTGRPVFFFHGYPSSRLEAVSTDAIARRRRIRVIAIDRPGFGLSTFQPGRRITDWPADVKSLADHLRLRRFAVLGGSGGSPYALVCAHALPREMLTGVGVLAGMGTWDVGNLRYVSTGRRLLAMAAHYWPAGLRVATGVIVSSLRWLVTTRTVSGWIDAWLDGLAKKKEQMKKAEPTKEENQRLMEELDESGGGEKNLKPEERREKLLRVAFSGFSQDARGLVQETQLISQDWGFKLEDITYDPVKLWHGTKDTNAPIGWARSTVSRLPHGHLQEFDDDHYAIGFRLEEVLEDLVSGGEFDDQAERNNTATV